MRTIRSRLTASLAVVALLLVGALGVGCSRKKPAERLAEAGAEDWVVDGAAYRIQSTHYERGPNNSLIYVMEYPAPQGTSLETVDKDGAGILAWPLVKYAYNNRRYMRGHALLFSTSAQPQIELAVDVLSPDGKKLLFRHQVPAGK